MIELLHKRHSRLADPDNIIDSTLNSMIKYTIKNVTGVHDAAYIRK